MTFRQMNRGAAWIALCAMATSGCSSNSATRDYNLVFTDVKPIQYARILCRGIPIEDQHTCMTSVIEHQAEARDWELTPAEVVDGPFVVLLGDDLYRGSYVSNPFAAAFTISNGYNICRGRYDAFNGDTEAVFDLYCDDGSRGMANIILDTSGSNGVGILDMDDGRRGRIVFGHAAVGGDFL